MCIGKAKQQKKSDDDEVFISEGAVYRLICKSTTEVISPLPEAIEFEKWVFDELLPTLRRTGTYTIRDGNFPIFLRRIRTKLDDLKKVDGL